MQGKIGECPEWFLTMKSARSLGVPPWDYAGLPETRTCIVWREWALATDVIEAEAHAEIAKRAQRRVQ